MNFNKNSAGMRERETEILETKMFLTATKTNKTLRLTQEILSQSAGYEGQ